jgi:hypothetical protein
MQAASTAVATAQQRSDAQQKHIAEKHRKPDLKQKPDLRQKLDGEEEKLAEDQRQIAEKQKNLDRREEELDIESSHLAAGRRVRIAQLRQAEHAIKGPHLISFLPCSQSSPFVCDIFDSGPESTQIIRC